MRNRRLAAVVLAIFALAPVSHVDDLATIRGEIARNGVVMSFVEYLYELGKEGTPGSR